MEKREPKTLQELRKEFRYTIKQLSEGSGVPYGTMVAYCCAYRKLNLKNAAKIANFLGISVEDIRDDFGKEDKK